MLGFLSKDPSHMLFFDGETSNLEHCFDTGEAIDYNNDQPLTSDWQEVDFSFYGQSTRLKIPLLPMEEGAIPKSAIDTTDKIKQYIGKKAAKDLISDQNFGKWNEVFANYKIYSHRSVLYFFKLKSRNFLDFNKDSEEELIILSMVEFMQGYVRIDPIYFQFQGAKKPLGLGMSRTFSARDYNNFVDDTIRVGHNYTIALRRIMFEDTFKQFEKSGLLQSRQYKCIKYLAKSTYIVAPRRSGKSYVLSYIALRELFMQSFKPEVRERPVTILYLSTAKGLNLQIKKYMDKMISRMAKDENQKKMMKGLLHWDSVNQTYSLNSGGDVIGQIIFLTAKGEDVGIGYPGDLIIIDEMFKIPFAVKEGLDAICDGEDAKFIGASTMYHDSPKDWAWKDIVNIEKKSIPLRNKNEKTITDRPRYKELSSKDEWSTADRLEYQSLVDRFWNDNPEISLRFTVDDIDRHTKSGRAEKRKKKYLDKGDYHRYLTELFSRFPEEGSAVSYKKALMDPINIPETGFLYLVGSNDPALSPIHKDINALMLLGYDEYTNKIYVIDGAEIIKTGKVIDSAKDIKQKIKARDKKGKKVISAQDNRDDSKCVNIHLTGDASVNQKSTWELYEQYGLYYNATISSRPGNQQIKQTTYNTRNRDVPSKLLIDTFQKCIDNGWLGINSNLLKLKEEFNTYIELKPGKYGAMTKKDTDDRIAAVLCGVFYLYHIMNVKSFLTKEVIPRIDSSMNKEEIKKIRELKRKKAELEKRKLAYAKDVNEYYSEHVY